MKTILILTGSPRKGGNTDMLAAAFAKGAEAAGHKVLHFSASAENIRGCVACNKCFSTGQACVFDDGFNKLAPLLAEADVLVLATPLYWFSFSAQIKAAFDKLYAFIVGGRPLHIRETVLLACAAGTEEHGFDGLIRSYELIASYMEWKNLGCLSVPGVSEKGDILKTDALERAEEMGRRL